MKTVFTLFSCVIMLEFTLVSCDNKDDFETMESVERIAIDSVKISKDTMNVNTIQQITTYSNYKNGCQGFYAYDYIYADAFAREVTAYAYNSNGNCQTNSYVLPSKINFRPTAVGTYTFKFWKGNGNWATKTIVVE